MDTVEEITKENYIINIYQDELAESPREWDNLGTMVCAHSRYILGDDQIDNGDDFLESLYWEYLTDDDYDNWDNAIEKMSKMFFQDNIVLPLYLYDHSGISMATTRDYPFNCPWDSGQVGYIYVSKEQVRKEYGWKYITKKREKFIADYLRVEVETYNQYLTGDVYFFHVECEKCREILDSCGGFYGHNWKENGLLEYAEHNHVCPNCDISGLLH